MAFIGEDRRVRHIHALRRTATGDEAMKVLEMITVTVPTMVMPLPRCRRWRTGRRHDYLANHAMMITAQIVERTGFCKEDGAGQIAGHQRAGVEVVLHPAIRLS